jgi:hypothetical protein
MEECQTGKRPDVQYTYGQARIHLQRASTCPRSSANGLKFGRVHTIDDTPCETIQRVLDMFTSSTTMTLEIKVPIPRSAQSFSENANVLGVGPSLERGSNGDGKYRGDGQRGKEDGLEHGRRVAEGGYVRVLSGQAQ